jgi:hypothetical protein
MPTAQQPVTAPALDAAQRHAQRQMQSQDPRVEGSFDRIAPMLMRAAAETAAAFLCVPAALGSAWEAPRFSIPDALHCSQMNMGDKHQFLFNLSVEKAQWDKLFAGDIPDSIKLDAYCELANCICGTILADAAFAGEFGYMIPCVPCNGVSRPAADSRIERGSMIVGGAWIRFTFALRENDAA